MAKRRGLANRGKGLLDLSDSELAKVIAKEVFWSENTQELQVVCRGLLGQECPESIFIPAYLKNKFTRGDMLKMKKHIDSCASCQGAVSEILGHQDQSVRLPNEHTVESIMSRVISHVIANLEIHAGENLSNLKET